MRRLVVVVCGLLFVSLAFVCCSSFVLFVIFCWCVSACVDCLLLACSLFDSCLFVVLLVLRLCFCFWFVVCVLLDRLFFC